MRRSTLTFLVAAVVAGCAAAPQGPIAITDVEGPVIGFAGATDVDYEARITPVTSVVATGTLDATDSTFRATFDAVPPGELQTIDDFVAPILGKGGTCDLVVAPADLEIAIVASFVGADVSGLQLAVQDPWAPGPPAVGDTRFQFVFANRDGSIAGACTDAKGGITTFEMPLARGWNPVAISVEAVYEGLVTERRWRTQTPGSDASWWYRAQVKKII